MNKPNYKALHHMEDLSYDDVMKTIQQIEDEKKAEKEAKKKQ